MSKVTLAKTYSWGVVNVEAEASTAEAAAREALEALKLIDKEG